MTIDDELRDHIRTTVDTWPPLSPAQSARLAAILAGADARGPALQPAPDAAHGRRRPSSGRRHEPR